MANRNTINCKQKYQQLQIEIPTIAISTPTITISTKEDIDQQEKRRKIRRINGMLEESQRKNLPCSTLKIFEKRRMNFPSNLYIFQIK